ncbi:MAG: hypothetical protein M3R14_10580 [Acidobacteriota bacterium]|nr:hypothetical protein [Acidobacteriota bacterium]
MENLRRGWLCWIPFFEPDKSRRIFCFRIILESCEGHLRGGERIGYKIKKRINLPGNFRTL